jgi:hypothetical protein
MNGRGLMTSVLPAAFMIGCKGGSLTEADVKRLIAADRAEQAKLASSKPADLAHGDGSGAPHAETADPAIASLEFLSSLEKLMDGYQPQLPALDDATDVLRCLTSDALASKPELAAARGTLEKRRAESERVRASAYAEFAKLAPVQFRIDYGWKTRRVERPPVYGCWYSGSMAAPAGWHPGTKSQCDSWSNYGDNCQQQDCAVGQPIHGDWKIKVPGKPAVALYTQREDQYQPPELMKRIESAGITVPPRFSCRVADVEGMKDLRQVACVGGSRPVMLRISGKMAEVNVGDTVSVPLANAQRDPDGVLSMSTDGRTWIVDGDGAQLTVDKAAQCPSTDEILHATATAKP